VVYLSQMDMSWAETDAAAPRPRAMVEDFMMIEMDESVRSCRVV
jgi:hypothetical protein